MKSKVQIPRSVFKQALDMVKPALSVDNFIPITTCFCFTKEYVYAYDNTLGIAWPLKTGAEGGIFGEKLSKLVALMKGKEINFAVHDDVASINSGRSTFKAPLLDKSKFLLESPFLIDRKARSIPITEKFSEGLEKCLISVGNDPMHAAHMGISIVGEDDKVRMYSTDNRSLSRYVFKMKKLKPFPQVVLPVRFCQQLLTLKDLEDVVLDISTDSVGVKSVSKFKGKRYILFSKLLYEGEVPSFENIIDQFTDKKQIYFPITDGFISCLDRAMILLSSEIDKRTEVETFNSNVDFNTTTSMGRTKDVFVLRKVKLKKATHIIRTDLALRACKNSEEVSFGSNAMVFRNADKGFLHIVSNLREAK